jgi:release factor glutamine methyltransferase
MTQGPAVAEAIVAQLAAAGFVDAAVDADELIAAAGDDEGVLRSLVRRRLDGEPLAWLVGSVSFLGNTVVVHEGVYVPRPQSEALARRAVARLPERGRAVDLATGSGAIAVALKRARPEASVLGTEVDRVAARCARVNGVEVIECDLGEGIPEDWSGDCDVVVGVVPYVPSEALQYLPRDVRRHEPRPALDGGPGGMAFLDRAVQVAGTLLAAGGALLLELGGEQDAALRPTLERHGFALLDRLVDHDGDLRGIEAARLPL